MTTDPGDLVLDPTCGSGTTAFVAEKWGRRWITCDTSRVAVTLAKQRLMAASFDYYELKYPHEGLKGGFIYKTVPHVTLKAIANNPEIDEIYARMHPAIEKALGDLNNVLVGAPLVGARGQAQGLPLQEWTVPFDFPADWSESARKPFDAFQFFPLPKMIVFCAFTFDPEAAKDIDQLKGITALKAQMNTDLLTEDLKKARSSNQSFWLMGQPDVEVRRRKDGRYEVEVNGFDYFDTSKGELVSGGKKKIALWLLDTDYDERSLFPRQVFFPLAGGKEGWYKLKKNIRAELNEELLDQYHGTVSLPFEAGDNHKVAVKIVDDRGIEGLKILALED